MGDNKNDDTSRFTGQDAREWAVDRAINSSYVARLLSSLTAGPTGKAAAKLPVLGALVTASQVIDRAHDQLYSPSGQSVFDPSDKTVPLKRATGEILAGIPRVAGGFFGIGGAAIGDAAHELVRAELQMNGIKGGITALILPHIAISDVAVSQLTGQQSKEENIYGRVGHSDGYKAVATITSLFNTKATVHAASTPRADQPAKPIPEANNILDHACAIPSQTNRSEFSGNNTITGQFLENIASIANRTLPDNLVASYSVPKPGLPGPR